jgi:hypothetical protein
MSIIDVSLKRFINILHYLHCFLSTFYTGEVMFFPIGETGSAMCTEESCRYRLNKFKNPQVWPKTLLIY